MNLEVQHLSHTFLTDAAHLIEKARHANTSMAPNKRTSYIAKLVIDVYLACECALKSMIASANIDKPGAEVYARILNLGHNLKRLMKHADPKSIDADARNFLKQASKRGIHLRYSLELFLGIAALNRVLYTIWMIFQYRKLRIGNVKNERPTLRVLCIHQLQP